MQAKSQFDRPISGHGMIASVRDMLNKVGLKSGHGMPVCLSFEAKATTGTTFPGSLPRRLASARRSTARWTFSAAWWSITSNYECGLWHLGKLATFGNSLPVVPLRRLA